MGLVSLRKKINPTMSNQVQSFNVVILGHGAIGSLWSYHLSKIKNVQLSFIGSEGLAKSPLKQNFTFTNIHGLSFQYQVKQATTNDLANAHLIIACLKSFQMANALNPIANRLNAKCDIILCHNGMGVSEELNTNIISKHRLYTLLTTHGCLKANKRHVIHTGLGHCDLGKTFNQECEIKPAWFSMLNNALPKMIWHNNIKQKQWQKLAVNCVINPITATYKLKNGQVREARFDELVTGIATEVAMVAEKEKVELNRDFITNTALTVAQRTRLNTSSMLADVLADRETEIDNINGYIVSLAKQYSLSVPYNQQVIAEVKALKSLP